MTEAIVQAQPAADGPVSRLLGFYAAGSRSEAGKLTLAMIEESAKHLKLAPKIDLRLVKTTEMVRVGWLRLVSENENEEVAEQFAARWKEAFAGAPKLKDKLEKLHLIKPRRLGWTPGAKEIYEAELDRLYSETDERKSKLWGRTPEKIMRAASVFAACRFDKVVERGDAEIAQTIMHLSDETFKLGIDEAEDKRQLNHAEMKLSIERKIRFVLGPSSDFEIRQHFRHNTKHKKAVGDALEDMLGSGIFKLQLVKTGGRAKTIYWLLEWGDAPGTLEEAVKRWEAWKSG